MMKTLLFFAFLTFFIMPAFSQKLLPTLQKYCKNIEAEFSQISEERKENLSSLIHYIQEKVKNKEKISLIFICTHNSRRSQFGQIWAKTAATYYQLEVHTYSGGTESTACNPRTIAALERAGFITKTKEQITATNNNPEYELTFSKSIQPTILFSKKYNDEYNPQQDFAAILVCSSADQACPLVKGASLRIYNGYEDPKKSDGQPDEILTYDETCRLIARELFYVFSQAKK